MDLTDIEDDLAGEPVPETTEKVKPLRMKISKAKERALMKEFGLDETVLSEEDMAKRRQRLKTLITLGKTRGYLTQGEISDHLPDKLVDAETMEVVVTMLNDLGVAVYEQTPDAEMLLLNNTAPDRGHGGRSRRRSRSRPVHGGQRIRPHHRPGAHVHARNGHRRAADARRRNRNRQAHRRRPDGHDGGHQRLARHDRRDPAPGAEIREGKVVISTVVDGFSNPNEADDFVAEEDFDEYDEADDDDGNGGSKALTKKLEELKTQALERFDRIAQLFEKVHKIYDKEGYGTPAYNKAQQALSEELMTIRFTAKTIEKLCDMVRGQVDDVRKKERELRRIIVDKCGMPQERFIKDFPPNLLNLKWVEKQAAAGKPWSVIMARNIPPIQELQQKLTDLQSRVVVPLAS
jgi:RNA polymerase primary sigma factor